MPLGEAILTQRSIRRLRPAPMPGDDLRRILEAASKAPSGGNSQPTRFLVPTNPGSIGPFGALYREARWAKRRDEGLSWPVSQSSARSWHSRGKSARQSRRMS